MLTLLQIAPLTLRIRFETTQSCRVDVFCQPLAALRRHGNSSCSATADGSSRANTSTSRENGQGSLSMATDWKLKVMTSTWQTCLYRKPARSRLFLPWTARQWLPNTWLQHPSKKWLDIDTLAVFIADLQVLELMCIGGCLFLASFRCC